MDSSSTEIICPINAEWKFNKADLMDLMESENGCFNGKCYNAFNIPGLRYFIRIYPNGDTEEHRGETHILFLCYGYGEGKVTTEITVTNESSNYSLNLNATHENADECFCDTSEFFDPKNNYFVKGEFTIKAEGFFKAERPPITGITTPISMRWKIKEDDLMSVIEESSDGFLCSEKISFLSFAGVKYYLAIYPNKIRDGNEPETFIYLLWDVENDTEAVSVAFDVYVDSVNYSSTFQHGYDQSNGRGYRLCTTSDLFDPSNKFIANGYLTVDVNGFLVKEKKEFVSIFCENGVALKSAWKKNDKDLMIIVGDKQIEVHKQVLIDASPVFAGMLESGTKATTGNKISIKNVLFRIFEVAIKLFSPFLQGMLEFRTKEEIENKLFIGDFSFKIVEAAIKLCYRKNGPRELIFEEMLSLFKFADKYRIEFMMDSVEEYLIKEISPSNVVCLIKFSSSDSLNATKLYQSSIDYLIKCSKDSTPVYASECLDVKLLAEMYLKTLHSCVF